MEPAGLIGRHAFWCLLLVASLAAPAQAESPLFVETAGGPVTGAHADAEAGVRVYRGIPYATPPVGELRWRAPVAHPPWKEVRDATEFGTPCWQSYITGLYSRGPVPRSEDCLYLNVWTGAHAGEKRPVMVWIHGGGFSIGHGHLDWYDGTDAARDGMVTVSLNYRLGPLGFFAHPWLEGEDANGNQGLRDQIAALAWVRDNIAAFGGDPGNVTIFGESAGSSSVCYLQAAPAAKGLFHRAIGESGGCFAPHATLHEGAPTGAPSGYAMGRALVELLGAADLGAMRDMSPEAIYAATEEAGWEPPYPSVWVDGDLFPAQMRELYVAGLGSRTPVLVGANADEETALFDALPDVGRDELVEQLKAEWGAQAEALIAAYGAEIEASPRAVRDLILSHRVFAWDMRTWAELTVAAGQPAYLYHFTHVPELVEYGRDLGAFHAAEIPYVFGTIENSDLVVSEADKQVSLTLSAYWRNFARTGNPNGAGLPHWPAYTLEDGETMELAEHPQVIEHHLREKLDVMSKYFEGLRGAVDDGL